MSVGKKLTDLDATFVKYEARVPDSISSSNYQMATNVDERHADGVLFECPLCGAHSVLVWFAGRNIPSDLRPLPRWHHSGSSLQDLTITPSINLDVISRDKPHDKSDCKWHGFVTNGCAA